MADIAWTRKYRPSSFDDYMGDDVKRMVQNRFSNRDNIPNTIMLYGTRGTGKTSMARLLAKEIHCLSPVDGHSCGQCEMCREIDEYISSTEAGVECTGITEVDAATTTGKGDINDIIEEALVPPLYPLNYKVLILDECHMLSTSAQNSLLKVIEEPPEHLIFILCTTDPEKVIGTIHSRIQLKIEVRRKSVEELAKRLLWIAEQENVTTSEKACEILAKKGDRIPRECIGLLEEVAKATGGSATVEDIKNILNDVDTKIYVDFFTGINKHSDDTTGRSRSLEDICRFNLDIQEKDISVKEFLTGLAGFIMDAMNVRHGVNLDDYPKEFIEQVKEATKFYKTENEFLVVLKTILETYARLDSDDTKSKLSLTVMAMQLTKPRVTGRAKTYNDIEDLGNQTDMAKTENGISIQNYRELMERTGREAIEKVEEMNLKKEGIASLFSSMTELDGSENLDNGIEEEQDVLSERKKRMMEIISGTNNG